MKAVQLVINLAYIITLVAAGMATSGFLAASCFSLAVLNTIGLVFIIVAWAISDGVKKSKDTPSDSLLKLAAALDTTAKRR